MKRLQAGIRRQLVFPGHTYRANGLLLRGVVMATYVVDDENHPAQPDNPEQEETKPKGVYCDVLTYSSLPNTKFGALPAVLVSQPRGGLHDGKVWMPKATTKDITGAPFNPDVGTNPANMDGDHVLIGFIDDNLNQPVILRGIHHPNTDYDKYGDNPTKGRKLQLRKVDGDPEYFKHHGSYYGIDDNGNYVLDTTFANDGTTDDLGNEPTPPIDGKGSVANRLPKDAEWALQFLDMTTTPGTPITKAEFKWKDGSLESEISDPSGFFQGIVDGSLCYKFQYSGADAELTLGDGAVAVAVADHLQTLYASLKTYIETAFVNTVWGPSSTILAASGSAPPWDPNINSDKLTIPDTG